MRKRIPISLLTILLCFYNIYNGELAFAQSAQKAEVVQTVKDTRYTVTPVDEEWKNLKTHADMVAVCQLPDEFVENASTEELFDAVMEYPMMFDLFCYDTLSIGIEEVTKQFNGLHELLQREDFAKILKEKYQEQEIPKAQHYNYNNVTLDKQDTILQDKSTREKVYRDFYDKSVSLLEEALFTQKGVFEQYSALEQKEIIFEVLDKRGFCSL